MFRFYDPIIVAACLSMVNQGVSESTVFELLLYWSLFFLLSAALLVTKMYLLVDKIAVLREKHSEETEGYFAAFGGACICGTALLMLYGLSILFAYSYILVFCLGILVILTLRYFDEFCAVYNEYLSEWLWWTGGHRC